MPSGRAATARVHQPRGDQGVLNSKVSEHSSLGDSEMIGLGQLLLELRPYELLTPDLVVWNDIYRSGITFEINPELQ